MKKVPLLAIALAGELVFGGCGGHSSETLSKPAPATEAPTTSYSPRLKQNLLAGLAIKEKDFESQVREGKVLETARLGECAIVGSRTKLNSPKNPAYFITNPAILKATIPNSNISAVEDAGYKADADKFVFGPPSLLRDNGNGKYSVAILPSSLEEHVIRLPQAFDASINAMPNDKGDLIDENSGALVFSIDATGWPRNGHTFSEFAQSAIAVGLCEPGWEVGQNTPSIKA